MVYASCLILVVMGLVTSNADVDTAWMNSTLQNHFSKPRHHVTNPTYKAAARDFIMNEFRSYGLDVYNQTFNTNLVTVKGVNLIGISKGKDFNTSKDQIVGVAAHYDTMNNTPGVDDNGAAVVAMLQTAKHMAKSRRDFTVIFVAFDFEEWKNLTEEACTYLSCGSRKFVSDWIPSFWATVPVLKGFIVMDTIANIQEKTDTQELPAGLEKFAPGVNNSVNSDGKRGDFLAAIGRPYDSDVLDAFVTSYAALGKNEFELEKINISVLTDKTLTQQQFLIFNDLIRSDHYSFWKNGMRAIFLTDTANFRGYMKNCYHNSCDTLSQFTPKMFQFLGKTTQALIDTVNKLAPSTDRTGGFLFG
ncbi:uncharacterized protein LOC124272237 isoform X2 [Haliotis rubra]|uniref:uncharacterized protein LOC124272237 isoform X2 n=1 Tax=Haliotis rubra TaxID=36100 RepID=UPI001EE56E1F|nr:uncharacterized protein LOC124272237 isoform X2 [Haliotis rubra]